MSALLGSVTIEALARSDRDEWLVTLNRPGRKSLARTFPDRTQAVLAGNHMAALHELPVLALADEAADG